MPARTTPYIFSEEECGCAKRERVMWLVSTSHRTLAWQGRDQVWAPVGLQHARQLGHGTTACGLPALTWTNFYDRRFVPGARGTCPECCLALQREAGCGDRRADASA